ncbi:mesencephalic astrocyte-derived neurotrophic factor homolog [Convolutriloba macropyga]|uniref:mesencephalic astrocyte-derived neurotrophic factor homolog n=1 Tax=Convolutriloba macropyga TaxID=536237 RepID=UPI003F52806C
MTSEAVKLSVFFTVILLVLFSLNGAEAKLREGDCEVCIKFLTKFEKSLTEADRKTPESLEKSFRSACKVAKGKDERFCYYVGALETSATGIVQQVVKPLKMFMPVEKICENKLKPLDQQICDLQYEKQIDLDSVDLNKLRVKELKKILEGWDEVCKGCTEKTDYIKLINELKPKYQPNKSEL